MMYFVDNSRPSSHDRAGIGEDEGSPAVIEPRTGGRSETATGHDPTPPGIHVAPHSQWPVVVAAAIAFTLFGLITSYAFCVVGVIVFIVGVVGWVAELIDE